MTWIGRYAKGEKYCRTCSAWKKWEGLWCPTCGYRLRIGPIKKEFKEKLKERVKA